MHPAPASSRWLEVLFYFLALAGLIGTNAQLPAYLHLGPVGGTVQFWSDALSSNAGIFLVVDILVLGAVVLVWMFGECRRLGIAPAWAWVYFLGSLLIGISFFFPLFMAHRQRRMRHHPPELQSQPRGGDLIAVALSIALVLMSVAFSLRHLRLS